MKTLPLVAALAALLVAPQAASAALDIDVISNRADLISAGDALVAIDGADPSAIRVTEDGRDVTGGSVIYGGRGLEAAPGGSGWRSAAFAAKAPNPPAK